MYSATRIVVFFETNNHSVGGPLTSMSPNSQVHKLGVWGTDIAVVGYNVYRDRHIGLYVVKHGLYEII